MAWTTVGADEAAAGAAVTAAVPKGSKSATAGAAAAGAFAPESGANRSSVNCALTAGAAAGAAAGFGVVGDRSKRLSVAGLAWSSSPTAIFVPVYRHIHMHNTMVSNFIISLQQERSHVLVRPPACAGPRR